MVNNQKKEAIISEYLKGGITYRALEKKTGIDYRTIHQWVSIFVGKVRNKKNKPTAPQVGLHLFEVKQLQEELRKAKLYNELLNTMIDIAEEKLKIDIRKKYGTKQ